MKLGNATTEELCHAAEGLSGTAASASLRKLGSLMERAPSGRLFEAIATLSDMSVKAAMALQDASRALEQSKDAVASGRLAEALVQMDALAVQGIGPKVSRRRAAR
jgi:hypothetical protein